MVYTIYRNAEINECQSEMKVVLLVHNQQVLPSCTFQFFIWKVWKTPNNSWFTHLTWLPNYCMFSLLHYTCLIIKFLLYSIFSNDYLHFLTHFVYVWQELKDPQCRDEMAAARGALKKNATMLYTASQAYLRHPDVAATRANRDYVFKQVQEAIGGISSAAQATSPTDEKHGHAGIGELAAALNEFDVSTLKRFFFTAFDFSCTCSHLKGEVCHFLFFVKIRFIYYYSSLTCRELFVFCRLM